jgi:acetyl/propionyl-CoA carboxylase alpha subunit
MLAKLCTWGRDRAEAIGRMKQALSEFKIGGLRTNLAQLGRIMADPEFASGVYDTGLLERMPRREPCAETEHLAIIAAALLAHRKKEAGERRFAADGAHGPGVDPWKLMRRPGYGRFS